MKTKYILTHLEPNFVNAAHLLGQMRGDFIQLMAGHAEPAHTHKFTHAEASEAINRFTQDCPFARHALAEHAEAAYMWLCLQRHQKLQPKVRSAARKLGTRASLSYGTPQPALIDWITSLSLRYRVIFLGEGNGTVNHQRLDKVKLGHLTSRTYAALDLQAFRLLTLEFGLAYNNTVCLFSSEYLSRFAKSEGLPLVGIPLDQGEIPETTRKIATYLGAGESSATQVSLF